MERKATTNKKEVFHKLNFRYEATEDYSEEKLDMYFNLLRHGDTIEIARPHLKRYYHYLISGIKVQSLEAALETFLKSGMSPVDIYEDTYNHCLTKKVLGLLFKYGLSPIYVFNDTRRFQDKSYIAHFAEIFREYESLFINSEYKDEYLKFISQYTNHNLDNHKTSPKELYESCMKSNNYSVIVERIKYFEKNGVHINISYIYEQMFINRMYADILSNIEVFRERNQPVDVDTIKDYYLSINDKSILISYSKVLNLSREEVLSIFNLLKTMGAGSWGASRIMEYVDIFLEYGIEEEEIYIACRDYFITFRDEFRGLIKYKKLAKLVYADLKDLNLRAILKSYPSFEMVGVKVDFEEVLINLIKSKGFQDVFLYLRIFASHDISFDHVWRLLIEVGDGSEITNMNLKYRMEEIKRGSILIEDSEMTDWFSGKAFQYKDEKRKDYIIENGEVFNLLVNFYLYQYLSILINKIKANPNFNSYLEFSHKMVIKKVEDIVSKNREMLFQYFKQYFITVVCTELDFQSVSINRCRLEVNPSFVYKYYSDKQIKDFFNSASRLFSSDPFNEVYGGRPWSQIARLAYDFWNQEDASDILIDHALNVEHHNGGIFDKDKLVLSNEDSLKFFLDMKSESKDLREYLKGLDELDLTKYLNSDYVKYIKTLMVVENALKS